MLLFRGAPALSSFRIERLLTAQRRVAPALCGIRVDYLHFVDLRRDLTPAETAVLERLLDFDRDHASLDGPGQLLLTVPRPGTISPWSSKATDIAHVCGLDAVARIERGRAWRIDAGAALAPAALGAIAAALHDPMTEAVMTDAAAAARLFTDRIQHVMWRHTDPLHPLYRAEEAAKHGGSILAAYQKMDSIVGKVLEKMPADAVLFVVSDHGFAPWRRTMNYNTWLAQEGYLRLKGESADRANLEDLFDKSGSFFAHVDRSRTRAYAMGLGNIYVNLKGREGQGIVEPGAEYDALVAEIKAKLPVYVDPENGEKPVAYVFTRDEAYGTYDPALIPDLFPSNSSGYRVGWQDALGMIAKSVTEPNLDVWSADHCSVYPPLVDGILFSNRPLSREPQPYMADIMPTVLEHG